jgi:hypothetical protein
VTGQSLGDSLRGEVSLASVTLAPETGGVSKLDNRALEGRGPVLDFSRVQ